MPLKTPIRLKESSVFSSVKCAEGKVPSEVQVLRVGKFSHPVYGQFEITKQVLAEMKANFDLKVRGIDLAFDYYHDSNQDASGWVKDLQLKEDGNELWALVDWTPKAQQKLSDRELRYFSPDFAFEWQDPETQTTFNNVLFGGGLTNRPFVKEMQAIVAAEFITKEGENHMTELEKALAALKLAEGKALKLADEVAAAEKKMAQMVPKPDPKAPSAGDPEEASEVEQLKKQIADLQAQLAKAQSDNSAMMAEKQAACDAQKLAEKTNEFNVLLTEGKACVAQKEAFLKGDMGAFIKLAQPLNLKASGSSASGNDEPNEDVKSILKLAEEKQKVNPKLSRGDAISLAKKELKK